MKYNIILILLFSLLDIVFSQSSKCWIDLSGNTIQHNFTFSPNTTTHYKEVVIIAVDHGANTALPNWYNSAIQQIEDFLYQATFGYFDYEAIVLKDNANHAFEMPYDYTPPYSGGCWHVHSEDNIRAVLQMADNIYDFSTYDFDGDGKVYVHFTSIGPKSGGVISNCIDETMDGVRVIVSKQTRGASKELYINTFVHECGHDFFDFPDMDHGGVQVYDHYGIGSFDVMSVIYGFEGIPSPYNPFFRDDRDWFHPYYIMEDWENAELKDFQTSKTCYIYYPSLSNRDVLPNQKFYISYHSHNPDNNYFYSGYPFKDDALGGVLVWHVKTNEVKKWGDYDDWNCMDVDIEYASGKYKWNIQGNDAINTMEPDPIYGRDSLEIRIVSGNEIVGGPFYGRPAGGSGAFFTPNNSQVFSFYTNPSSNWYYDDHNFYPQIVANTLRMKNLRKQGNNILVDFYVEKYIVTGNATLQAGTYYFDDDLIIEENSSLTLEPGVTIVFENHSSLIIKGELYANGNENNKIVFSSTKHNKGGWQGIVLEKDFGAFAEFENCKIEYSTSGINGKDYSLVQINNCEFSNNVYGVCCVNAIPEVKNSSFFNNTTAIFFNSCYTYQDWYYSPIENNTIEESTTGIFFYNDDSNIKNNILRWNNRGIFLNKSDAIIMKNFIEQSDYGIKIINNSYPDLYVHNNAGGFNEIKDNQYGIYNYSSCLANLGDWSLNPNYNKPGYNNFYNNSQYELVNENTQTILAEMNWWGNVYGCEYGNTISSAPPNPEPNIEGPVDWCPALSSPANTTATFSISDLNDSKKEDMPELLIQAKLFEYQNDYNAAKEKYSDYLLCNPKKYVNYACNLYVKSVKNYLKNDISGILSEINSLIGKISDFTIRTELYLSLLPFYMKLKKYESLENLLEYLDKEELSLTQKARLQWQQALLYIYGYEDIETGIRLLRELLSKYSKENEYYLLAHEQLKILNKETNISVEKTVSEAKPEILESIDNYEFYGNYPNPFNMTTNFSFYLPVESDIKIIIYDITGKKISEIIRDNLQRGMQKIAWQTANMSKNVLSSGVYLYTFFARALDGSGKEFVKNGRLLLIK